MPELQLKELAILRDRLVEERFLHELTDLVVEVEVGFQVALTAANEKGLIRRWLAKRSLKLMISGLCKNLEHLLATPPYTYECIEVLTNTRDLLMSIAPWDNNAEVTNPAVMSQKTATTPPPIPAAAKAT